jgi:hypothetical protein
MHRIEFRQEVNKRRSHSKEDKCNCGGEELLKVNQEWLVVLQTADFGAKINKMRRGKLTRAITMVQIAPSLSC